MELKEIGRERAYVCFNFGAWVYIGLKIYEGKTYEECLKIHSENIVAYIKDGKLYEIKDL